MATQIRPHPKVVQNTALTPPIRRETILYIECHISIPYLSTNNNNNMIWLLILIQQAFREFLVSLLVSLALISNLNGEVVKNGLSLRIRPSYSDDTFGYVLSLPSQFLALPAHGECNITPDKLLDSAQRQFLYYWNQFVNRVLPMT